ncbi:MAG: hypothetical protein AB1894_23055 [Chloroflexota bacterium]
MKRVCLTIFVIFGMFLAACGANDPQKAILGKWEHIEGVGGFGYEFFENGNLTLFQSGIPMTGNKASYRFVDDTHLELTISFPGEGDSMIAMQVSISGDTMTLTMESGGVQKLRRAK